MTISNINLINISDNGKLHKTGKVHTPASEFPLLFDTFRQSGKNSMTLFFHGGLNRERDGLDYARTLIPVIQNQFDSFPVIFIWETGIVESLRSELEDIIEQELFGPLINKLLKHVHRKLKRLRMGPESSAKFEIRQQIADKIENESYEFSEILEFTEAFSTADEFLEEDFSLDELDELVADLNADPRAVSALQSIRNNMMQAEQQGEVEIGARPDESLGYLSAEALHEIHRAGQVNGEEGGVEALTLSQWAFVVRIATRVLRRYFKKTHHYFPSTVIEELLKIYHVHKIGKFVWDAMKEKAAEAYGKNPPLSSSANGHLSPDDDWYGGTLFIQYLEKHIRENGDIRLNLIGHSAGAIHICHFLERARSILGPSFLFNAVIFLAPGCNFLTFKNGIVKNEASIRTFRIFTMTNAREIKSNMIPLVYPCSLLYFVSALLEDAKNPDFPIVGLERHLKGNQYASNPTIKAGQDFINGLPGGVAYPPPRKKSPGMRTDFRTHGGEHGPVQDRETLASIEHIIRNSPGN